MKQRFLLFVSICFFILPLILAQSGKVTELTVNSGGVELYVRVAGNLNSNNVLLAIHGGPGGSCDYMLSLEQLVNDNYSVVNYDQRGAGKSGKYSGRYSLGTFADDIEAIRNELGVEKINLFGHSWGGVVGLYYASVHPENVDKIILMGSGPTNKTIADVGQKQLGSRAGKLIEAGVIPANLPQEPLEMLKVIMPVYYSDPNYDAPQEIKNLYFDAEVSQKIITDIGAWNFDEMASKIKKKVLILWGRDDPFGFEMGEYNRGILTSADIKFVLIDNCGHYWQESENVVIKEVKYFLNQ